MAKNFIVLTAVVFVAACSTGPGPSTSPAPQRSGQVAPSDSTRAGTDSARGGGAPQPRPYNRVITRDAKTRRGMFAVHRVNDKLYFEIPRKGSVH